MSRVLACLVAVLALTAALAGCGEDETKANNDYVSAVNVAQDRFQRTEQDLVGEISTPSRTATEDRRTLDDIAAAVDSAVASLRAISVPSAVAALHRRLVSAVAGYRPVIRARRRAIGTEDVRELIGARDRFTRGSREVQDRVERAIEQINAKLQGT